MEKQLSAWLTLVCECLRDPALHFFLLTIIDLVGFVGDVHFVDTEIDLAFNDDGRARILVVC